MLPHNGNYMHIMHDLSMSTRELSSILHTHCCIVETSIIRERLVSVLHTLFDSMSIFKYISLDLNSNCIAATC